MLLYIHIPFCDSKCFYCSFNSYVDKFHLKDLYVDGLIKDLKNSFEKYLNEDNYIETVFIGGGTPSTLSIKHYEKIFKVLKPYLVDVKEITIESNPNSAKIDWLKGLLDLGINRVSFGVQSFNNEKLKFLGRNHNRDRAIKIIKEAKEAGFEHINMDLIYGCKVDTNETILEDIKIIKDLPIDHISAYSLTIEEDTKFYTTPSVKIDDYELSLFIFDELKKAGFEQYEISNFAKNEDARSKHNLGYWKYKEYIGCGSGAVGRRSNERYYKNKNIEEYIQNPTEVTDIEKLSDEDIYIEKILLGLRSNIGIKMDVFKSEDQKKVKLLIDEQKLLFKDGKVYNKNFLLADELALFIT